MTFIQDIQDNINYLKDNPQGYWFKAKLYGWGWVPVKWQGWAVTLVYIAAAFFLVIRLDNATTTKEILLTFLLPNALLVSALFWICYKKGEKPHWQWGPPKSNQK